MIDAIEAVLKAPERLIPDCSNLQKRWLTRALHGNAPFRTFPATPSLFSVWPGHTHRNATAGLGKQRYDTRSFYQHGIGEFAGTVYPLSRSAKSVSIPLVLDRASLAPTAVAPDDRILTIDILRALALFGVLMVNLVTEFRVSIFQQFVPSVFPASTLDRFLDAFVWYALDMKAFALFSVLFGIGLALQFDRLASRARPLYWLRRRLFVLLGFGVFHLLFIWNGDILTEYALAGLLVLPLIREDKETLGLVSLALFCFYLAMPALHLPIYWPSTETFARHVTAANQVYANGSLVQVWRFSLGELRMMFSLNEFVFPRTLALFLLGTAIWQSGILRNRQSYRREFLIFGAAATGVGLVLTAAEHNGVFAGTPVLGASMSNLAPTIQALGYAALTVVAVDLPYLRGILRLFAPLGRMSFTNYILQSVIFSWIFFGYGLGRFGRLSITTAFLLGTAIYIAQMAGSGLWLRWFRFGPLEWLWRSLMYGQAQGMLKSRMRSVETAH